MMRWMMGVAVVGVVVVGVNSARGEEPGKGAGVVRENIEWLDVWVPNVEKSDLPRVLLIGDSITRGYGPVVEKELAGKAYVARMATSKSVGDPALLREVEVVLSEEHYDIVHFNNGMHGWGYSEEEYRAAFPKLIETIRKGAPGAKLIWATTTPVRVKGEVGKVWAERTGRVEERNRIAGEVVKQEGIEVDDLFSLVKDHPEYYKADGVHFEAAGVAAEGKQVAGEIEKVMGK